MCRTGLNRKNKREQNKKLKIIISFKDKLVARAEVTVAENVIWPETVGLPTSV